MFTPISVSYRDSGTGCIVSQVKKLLAAKLSSPKNRGSYELLAVNFHSIRGRIHWPGKRYLNRAMTAFAIMYDLLHQCGGPAQYLSTFVFTVDGSFSFIECLLSSSRGLFLW